MATYSNQTNPTPEISFTVRHMVFAKVRGQSQTWSTTLD